MKGVRRLTSSPRLNAEQALEMAFIVAVLLKRERAARAKPKAAAAAE